MSGNRTDKRKFKRLAAYMPVCCQVSIKGEKREFLPSRDTTSKNISRGGMLLKWPSGWRCESCPHYQRLKRICEFAHCIYEGVLLPNMELMELELEIGFPKVPAPVKAWGKVVWVGETDDVDNYELGLEFTQMTEHERKAIADYIQERLLEVIEGQRRKIGELEKGELS